MSARTEPQPGSIGPGTLLKGRYRVEYLIGRGGMASVWRAGDEVLDRPVAIKLLSDTIASDPEFLARFRREARVAAALWHPNLIGIYDYADRSERPYLVMEFVPGGDLASRERRAGAIDPERLARELLGAVSHIHAAGIVHRDIKPQNVLIAPDGSARLIDFGIALPADATALTRAGHLLGTARYLAPEVLRGEAASERSDLYSCGVLLRDCLDAHSSPSLCALVNRLADPDPRGRPASAERALARLNEKPTSIEQPTERLRPASPPPPAPLATPAAPARWPWGKAAAALAALAVVAVLLVGALGGSGPGGGGPGRGEVVRARQAQEAGRARGDAAAPAGESEASSPREEAETPAVTSPAAEASSETGGSLNQEGYEMIQAGRYAEAVPVLEEAVDSYPSGSEDLEYAYALFNLGNALRLSGRPEEAIPVLEERLRIPDQTDVVRRELAAAESEAGV